MDPVDYLAASYYERWLWSAEQGLLRKGTIAAGEVEHMMERLAAGGPEPPPHRDPDQAARVVQWLGLEHVPMQPATRPRFVPGQGVRVRRMRPAGHTRCPRYVRGALGVVERVRGAAELPDLAVYGKDAPVEPVYAVAFRSDALWGRGRNRRARWRSTCGRATWRRPSGPSTATTTTTPARTRRWRCAPAPWRRCWPRRAWSPPTPLTRWLSCTSTTSARRTAPRWWRAPGSTPAYRERLLADGTKAIAELGFGGAEADTLVAVANTPTVQNVVVCTLCSCYPWPVLGLPPTWYKSPPYRARMVAEPRAVLREFGLELADEVEIRVWDSSAEVRYLVVPMRPAGTEGLTEEALGALVTRDCMIGTALPQAGSR